MRRVLSFLFLLCLLTGWPPPGPPGLPAPCPSASMMSLPAATEH